MKRGKRIEQAFPGQDNRGVVPFNDEVMASQDPSPEDQAIVKVDVRSRFQKEGMSGSAENAVRMNYRISEGPDHDLPMEGHEFASTRLTLMQIEAAALQHLRGGNS